MGYPIIPHLCDEPRKMWVDLSDGTIVAGEGHDYDISKAYTSQRKYKYDPDGQDTFTQARVGLIYDAGDEPVGDILEVMSTQTGKDHKFGRI